MRGNFSFHADVPVTGTTPFASTHNAPLPNPDELWGTCFPSELLSDDFCKGTVEDPVTNVEAMPLCANGNAPYSNTRYLTRAAMPTFSDIGTCEYCVCCCICMLASG
jgi:hypothetical protein